jgi:hypothetical protein
MNHQVTKTQRKMEIKSLLLKRGLSYWVLHDKVTN